MNLIKFLKHHPLLCGCVFAIVVCILCSVLSSSGIVALLCMLGLSLLFVIPAKFSLKQHILAMIILSLAVSFTSFLNYKYNYESALKYSEKSAVADCTVLSFYDSEENFITVKLDSDNIKARIYTEYPVTLLPSTRIRAKVSFYETERNDRFDSDGIYLSGFTDEVTVIQSVNTSSVSYNYFIVREKLKSLINLGNEDVTALARAMILGNKNELSGVFVSKFRTIGMSHVMAISGMHLMFAVMFFEALLMAFGVGIKPRAVCSIIVIWIFAAITGFPISCIRSAIMLTIYFAGRITDRIPETVTSLFFSAVVILCVIPYSLFDISFILSVCAVLGITTITPALNKRIRIGVGFNKVDRFLNYIKQIFTVSVGASVACIPAQIIAFREICVISPLSNVLLLIPVEMLFYIGFLSIFPFLSTISSFAASLFYNIICKVTDFLYSLPIISVSAFNPFFYIIFALLGVLIVGCCVYRAKFPKLKIYPYIIGYAVLCVLFSLINSTVIMGTARLTVVDVGNGNCNIITSGDSAVVIDCGGSDYKSLYEFLSVTPAKKIEVVALSHCDADHINYLEHLINSFEIGTIIYPEFSNTENVDDVFEKARMLGIEVMPLSKDMTLTVMNGITLDVFAERAYLSKLENNTSILYKLTVGENSAVFTGDMPAYQEYAYLDYGDRLDCDILVVSHHGAYSSSIKPILELYSPDYSVISVGENTYGNPSERTLERLNEISTVLRTDFEGNITFKFNKKGYKYLS